MGMPTGEKLTPPPQIDGRKYNVTLARLIKTVVGMNEKQQRIMLRLAEELLYRQKKPSPSQDSRSGMARRRSRQPRKPRSIIVNYTIGNQFYTGHIEDIHADGALIATNEDLAVGGELALAFSHPKFPDIFRVYGDIIHTTSNGIGVQFKNLSAPQRDRIKALAEWIKGIQAG